MECCVLIPEQLSLVLLPFCKQDDETIGILDKFDMGVTVWANRRLEEGTLLYPDDGQLRLFTLDVEKFLDKSDIRFKVGCYEELNHVDGERVRHCNWIRFVRFSKVPDTDEPDENDDQYDEEVNIEAFHDDNGTVFQVLRTIEVNCEIKARFDACVSIQRSIGIKEGFTQTQRTVEDSGRSSMLFSDEQSSKKTMVTNSGLDDSQYFSYKASKVDDEKDRPEWRKTPPGSDHQVLSGHLLAPSSRIFSPPSLFSNVLLASTPYARNSSNDNSRMIKRQRERTWLPCSVCGKKFDRPSLLRRHMRTHTGEKPHACDICGKAFSTSSSLNTHRRIHSGEKPHQCTVCGKRFTASSNLYYHKMTHNKEKPHKCTLCSKSFPTPGDLRSHMYVHNGSWPYRCEICQRGFSKPTNLKNHLLLHTGDKPYECETCGKKFALQCNLKTHMKTHEEEISTAGSQKAENLPHSFSIDALTKPDRERRSSAFLKDNWPTQSLIQY